MTRGESAEGISKEGIIQPKLCSLRCSLPRCIIDNLFSDIEETRRATCRLTGEDIASRRVSANELVDHSQVITLLAVVCECQTAR
jgi:hypothetical protein